MPTRRTTRKRRGGSVVDNLKRLAKSANEQAKATRVLSKTLKSAGYDMPGAVVQTLGYGRRRRRMRPARRGGNFLSSLGDFGKNILKVPGNVIMGSAAGLNQGISGLGHRRRRGGSFLSTLSKLPKFERPYTTGIVGTKRYYY
jgi:hypothetical protein